MTLMNTKLEWTPAAAERSRQYLARPGFTIPKGLGTKESACSLAAINLALTGEMKDTIPDCMSKVIGTWIIRVQDRMPDDLRNAPGWRDLLPLAAGSGREKEAARLNLVLDWLWRIVLPEMQEIAGIGGYGRQWQAMCDRSPAAVATAADADAAVHAAAWGRFDPIDLLRRLVAV